MKQEPINFKLIILDVDGVLTDGGMYYSESGDEFKKFNTKDGLAIQRLTKKGIQFGIISNGKNANIINNRAQHLGIQQAYCGSESKIKILNKFCTKLKITLEEVAYIGDDVNDLECMKLVALPVCPADAVSAIKDISKIILKHKGGDACVREFLDMYFD